jgi:branched-chain amino acid aminotransferase group I
VNRSDLPDPRNADIRVWVGERLFPRAEAAVSVFDSSVQGGDAVWEGLRVYDGGVFRLAAHLDRLFASARELAFAGVPSRRAITAALGATLAANGMRDDAHVRLTLTRGPKVTSGMSPTNNRAGCTLIVLAEWKPPVWNAAGRPRGLRLVTSTVRRNPPQCLPSRIHHANLLNNILAKLEADAAGVDEALMLDIHGHVAETNATNVFLAKDGALATPIADACLPGITRAVVLELARAQGIDAREARLSHEDFLAADEVFCTGTMGELAPVVELDGHAIGAGAEAGAEAGAGAAAAPGPVTARLAALYQELVRREREPLPISAEPAGDWN